MNKISKQEMKRRLDKGLNILLVLSVMMTDFEKKGRSYKKDIFSEEMKKMKKRLEAAMDSLETIQDRS